MSSDGLQPTEPTADVDDSTPLGELGRVYVRLREVVTSIPSDHNTGPSGQQAREMAATLAEIVRLANAHLAILSHVAVRGGAYRNCRLSSPAQSLASETGCTVSEAHQVFRVGKRAAQFPAVAEALADGALMLSQADDITSALSMAPSDRTAEELVELASRRDAAALRERCDTVRRNARGPLDHARARAKRNVRRWIDKEGISNLLLRTSSDDFIRIIATLDAEIDARVLANRDPDLTPDMLAADALTDLICGYRMDRTAQRAEDVALFERLRRSAQSFRDGDRPPPYAEDPHRDDDPHNHEPTAEAADRSPDDADAPGNAHSNPHADPQSGAPSDHGTTEGGDTEDDSDTEDDGDTGTPHGAHRHGGPGLEAQVEEVFAAWDDIAWWDKLAAADPDAEYAPSVSIDTDGSTVYEYPDGRFERFTADGQLALLRLPKPETDEELRPSRRSGPPPTFLSPEEGALRFARALIVGIPPRHTAANFTAPPDTYEQPPPADNQTQGNPAQGNEAEGNPAQGNPVPSSPDDPWSNSRRHDWLPNTVTDYARPGPEPAPDSHGWGSCPTCGHNNDPEVLWRRSARPKAIIRIDGTALARGAALDGETVDLAGYGPIPIEALRSVLSDAVIAIMVTDGTDVTNVTHLSRKHTAAQSTVLEWLIGNRCSVPGCQNRRRVAWDHINEWRTVGTTTIDDTQGQCDFHHPRKPESHDFRTDPSSPGHIAADNPDNQSPDSESPDGEETTWADATPADATPPPRPEPD